MMWEPSIELHLQEMDRKVADYRVQLRNCTTCCEAAKIRAIIFDLMLRTEFIKTSRES